MLQRLARLGYASKAMIYAIVGLLALATATQNGGVVTDPRGALRVVLTQPFGRLLLVVLAVGLCGYAAWRLLDAFADPDRDGTSASGLITRIGNAVRGLIYGGIGLEAFRLFRGLGGTGGDEAERFSARILEWPFGPWLVGLAGAIIIAYGMRELLRGVAGRDDHKVEWSRVPQSFRTAVRRISRFGVGIRGALLGTLGVFLMRSAITHDPNAAAGQRESFLWLGGLVEGRWFLAVIAAGVIAYAVDQAAHASYRRIRPVV